MHERCPRTVGTMGTTFVHFATGQRRAAWQGEHAKRTEGGTPRRGAGAQTTGPAARAGAQTPGPGCARRRATTTVTSTALAVVGTVRCRGPGGWHVARRHGPRRHCLATHFSRRAHRADARWPVVERAQGPRPRRWTLLLPLKGTQRGSGSWRPSWRSRSRRRKQIVWSVGKSATLTSRRSTQIGRLKSRRERRRTRPSPREQRRRRRQIWRPRRRGSCQQSRQRSRQQSRRAQRPARPYTVCRRCRTWTHSA